MSLRSPDSRLATYGFIIFHFELRILQLCILALTTYDLRLTAFDASRLTTRDLRYLLPHALQHS